MADEKKATTHVTIACKFPPGLTLRLFDIKERPEPILGGGTRMVKVAEPIPDKVIQINGPQKPFGAEPRCVVVAGYALTPNVPIEFWKAYKEQNPDSDLIKNKLLFAYPSIESASAAAKDHRKVKSGLEPLDMSMKQVAGPNGTPRMVASDDRVPRAPGLSIQKEGVEA